MLFWVRQTGRRFVSLGIDNLQFHECASAYLSSVEAHGQPRILSELCLLRALGPGDGDFRPNSVTEP
jgi:hypothetical protein